MKEHKRRERYWQYYHIGHTTEILFLITTIADLVKRNPCPRPAKNGRGRPPVHSDDKMDFICLLMVALNLPYRGIEKWLLVLKIPWNEPVPDHTTISRHLQTIPQDWLDSILAETARRCMEAVGWTEGSLGADSSAVETDRYGLVTRLNGKEGIPVETLQKIYLKYHIVAILGLQIILKSMITSSNVNDSPMLPKMLEGIEEQNLDLGRSVLNADRGYDSDENCGKVFGMGMTPNIRQRKNAVNSDRSSRRRAAEIFDPQEYKKRPMIEGIFGAEEAKNHQLHCRFLKEENRIRLGAMRAIGWNISVLNRFVCANRIGAKIPTYAA